MSTKRAALEARVKRIGDQYLGHTIKIIELKDPYEKYNERTGQVKGVGIDAWDDIYLSGTWGGLNVYVDIDEFEIID